MKRLLIFFTISLFCFSCENERIEMMPPYVFFVNDIDYYVMDGDNANPVPVTVKGSMSAEGFLESIRLGDQAIGIDSIGDETRFMFSLEVDIRGRSPFDLVFSCTDKLGNVDEKPFHFLASEAVDLYTVTLGAQNNSNYGFYFSFTDRKVYSVAEFADKKDDDGFCYGFNISKSVPLFVSPTELARQSIISQTGNKVSSFCGIVAVNNVTFNKTEFDAIRNDAFMRNLNGSEYGTFAFNQIEAGRSYLIKSSAGKRGVVYVQKIESGVAGYVELLIKLQK